MLDGGTQSDWLRGVEPTDASPNRRWARFLRPDGAVEAPDLAQGHFVVGIFARDMSRD